MLHRRLDQRDVVLIRLGISLELLFYSVLGFLGLSWIRPLWPSTPVWLFGLDLMIFENWLLLLASACWFAMILFDWIFLCRSGFSNHVRYVAADLDSPRWTRLAIFRNWALHCSSNFPCLRYLAWIRSICVGMILEPVLQTPPTSTRFIDSTYDVSHLDALSFARFIQLVGLELLCVTGFWMPKWCSVICLYNRACCS